MPEILASTFVLAVLDLDASRRFYVEKLGFNEDLSVDGWSFLSRGACRLRLGHCPGVVPMTECPDHSWMAYLHVDDAAALYAEVVAKGWRSGTRWRTGPGGCASLRSGPRTATGWCLGSGGGA